MTAKEIIRKAMAKVGISQSSLSEKLEYSTKTAVGAILNKNNSLRTDVFCKWLDVLGFEIVIRPKNCTDSTEWLLNDKSDDEQPHDLTADLPKASPRKPIQPLPKRRIK